MVRSLHHLIGNIWVCLGDGDYRYAVTNDVRVTQATYMQFHISMGCSSNTQCYGKYRNSCVSDVT